MENMKKLISWILVLSFLILPMPVDVAAASDTTEGDWTYWIDSEAGCAVITAYTGTATDVEIPETLGGYPVVEIGSSAFYDNDVLASVTIPDSVETIGDSAFSGCNSLTSVTIPDSVQTIGNYAFSGCYELESVYISDLAAWCEIAFLGEFYAYQVHPSNPFHGAENLYLNGELVTELVIPEGVTHISACAFTGCESLISVTIPDSVQSIGKGAFYECSNLVIASLGKGVNTIGSRAFGGFMGSPLSHVLYAGTQEQWGAIAIDSDNYQLEEIAWHYAEEGHTVSTVETCSAVQYHCTQCGLVAATTKNMADHEFVDGVCAACGVHSGWSYEITDSTSVTITGYVGTESALTIPATIEGMSVTEIAYPGFFDNDILTSITIPKSVKSIQKGAFYSCSRLEDVHISDLSAWCGMTWEPYDWYFEISSANPLYYAEKLYLNGELVTDLVIPEDVTSIGEYAFGGCDSITSVTLPAGVQSVGSGAFDECEQLAAVYISDLAAWCNTGFASASSNPLYYAEDLYLNGALVTDLVIPQGVTEIAYYAFCGCGSLTSVEIPEGVIAIGNGAFYNCDGLRKVEISDTVQTIGDEAFYRTHSSVPTPYVVVLGKGVTRIGLWAFLDASGYSDAQSIKHLVYTGTQDQWNAISIDGGNINLTNATRHYNATADMVTSAYFCSYSQMTCTECGVFSTTVDSTPSHSFTEGICSHCGASADWRYSVSIDGTASFNGYTGTAPELIIPEQIEGLPVTYISPKAFYNNTVLTSVTISDSVESIGNNAFNYCKNLTNVTLGGGVASIGASAFRNCSSLQSVVIPEGVTMIEAYTFSGCVTLSAITLPATLTEVKDWAFYNCKNLDHVLYGGTQTQQESLLIDGTNDTFLTATWHCSVNETSLHVSTQELCSAVALFDCDVCDATCWKAKPQQEHSFVDGKCADCGLAEDCPWHYTINGTGVEITGYDAAQGGDKPKIPETIEGLPVTSIGNRALVNCDSITSITIPETVETIGYSAFRDCAQLLEVRFGGTQEQWEEILVDSNNAPLLEALLKYLASMVTGDVNGDDAVTRDDAIRVLLYVLNPSRFPLDAESDFNGDNAVTRDDAIRLLLYVLNPNRFPLETQ